MTDEKKNNPNVFTLNRDLKDTRAAVEHTKVDMQELKDRLAVLEQRCTECDQQCKCSDRIDGIADNVQEMLRISGERTANAECAAKVNATKIDALRAQADAQAAGIDRNAKEIESVRAEVRGSNYAKWEAYGVAIVIGCIAAAGILGAILLAA